LKREFTANLDSNILFVEAMPTHRPGCLAAAILIVLASVADGSGQSKGLAANDPVCGFLAKHFYLETIAVKQGVSVELIAGEPRIDRPVALRFFVNEKPRSVPLDDLQVEHEKLIHVFGVRDDLREFFHVHPAKVGPGMWAVRHTFARGGNYKLWSDVKYRGVSYSFGHPILSIPAADSAVEARETTISSERDGYKLSFGHPDQMKVGTTNRLEFVIRDAEGNVVATDNFLGAAMHLVAVKDDLSVFLHGHPDNHSVVTTNVFFNQMFPQAGNYRLFVQYRPGPAKLPMDEALLAEFPVRVAGE
jgi:hypothetical protein